MPAHFAVGDENSLGQRRSQAMLATSGSIRRSARPRARVDGQGVRLQGEAENDGQ